MGMRGPVKPTYRFGTRNTPRNQRERERERERERSSTYFMIGEAELEKATWTQGWKGLPALHPEWFSMKCNGEARRMQTTKRNNQNTRPLVKRDRDWVRASLGRTLEGGNRSLLEPGPWPNPLSLLRPLHALLLEISAITCCSPRQSRQSRENGPPTPRSKTAVRPPQPHGPAPLPKCLCQDESVACRLLGVDPPCPGLPLRPHNTQHRCLPLARVSFIN